MPAADLCCERDAFPCRFFSRGESDRYFCRWLGGFGFCETVDDGVAAFSPFVQLIPQCGKSGLKISRFGNQLTKSRADAHFGVAIPLHKGQQAIRHDALAEGDCLEIKALPNGILDALKCSFVAVVFGHVFGRALRWFCFHHGWTLFAVSVAECPRREGKEGKGKKAKKGALTRRVFQM